MKKLFYCLLFFAISISVTGADKYYITFAYKDDADTVFINALRRAGYEVHAEKGYWEYLTEAKKDILNDFHLVIITRPTTSDRFGDGGGALTALWRQVTTPVITMSNFITRNNRAQYFNTESAKDFVATQMVASDTSHPVFDGIELDENNLTTILIDEAAYGYCINPGVKDAGNGKVIAVTPGDLPDASLQNVVTIAEWGADTAFYPELGESAKNQGRRMWFAGTRMEGMYNADGIKLFLNAVEYMLPDSIPETVPDFDPEPDPGTDPVPSPAIMVEAEAYQAMNEITTEICSDTSAGENIKFTQQASWVEYTLDLAADYYDFRFRVASAGDDNIFAEHDTIRILTDGKIIGHLVVKNTGGADVWETITLPVKIETAGTKTIRLEMVRSTDSVKLNWFDYSQLNLGESNLAFNTSGQVSALNINGSNILGSSSYARFTMYTFDGRSMSSATSFTGSTNGNIYTLTASAGSPKFTFRIDTYPRHISLHLVDVEGIGEERNYGLKLMIQSTVDLGYKTLSDLVTASYSSSSYQVTLNWPYLHYNERGYYGGAVIYKDGFEGYELDKILAEIWTTEELMPKHAGQASWTSSDVLNWVDLFATRFNDLSVVNLEAYSLAELYYMVDHLAIPAGFKRIWLSAQVWRGEYFLYKKNITDVNTEVFPNGKEDLKAFADYLHDNNMSLSGKNVSLGVGKDNPKYMQDTVDRRLATWGSGKLEKAVGSNDKSILFRPDSSCIIPLINKVHTDQSVDFNYMRLGEELIKIGEFSRTEKDVWVLKDVTRGWGIPPAVSHVEGEEMAGLYTGFSKQYAPALDIGEDNSLADELITEYAEFTNEIGWDHIHFDGHNLHQIYSPWSGRPIFSGVYEKTNRPVTTSRVGNTIAANFELEFSKTKEVDSYNYWALDVGLRTNNVNSIYYASNFLGTHWLVHEGLMMGARRLSLSAMNHDDGITMEIMENHGLTDMVIKLLADLQKIIYILDDEDLKYISDRMTRPSNHYQSEDVFVLGKNENDKYIWTPYHVMGLSDGSTPMWYNDQENGAIDRNQIITNGDTLELTNPKAAQDLSFYIHNIDGSKNLVNPKITLSNGGYIEITGTIQPEEYLGFSSDSTSAIRYNEDWKPIETLESTISNFAVPEGNISISVSGSGGATSLATQFYVKGEPYILKTNDKL